MFYRDYPLKSQRLGFGERIGYRNRLRWLEQQGLQREHRILDYGCGAGLFLAFLRDNGYEHVTGYDAFVPQYDSPETLAATYDAVVSFDVIEHDENPRGFLKTLAALTRSGGLVAVGTPNADRVPIERKGDPNLHVPYHRHILSEQVLLEMGREANLQPAKTIRRSFYDSLVPTVNSRFMWRYIDKAGGVLDAAVEPPRIGLVATSPDLLFLAFFGYFVPLGDNMVIIFRVPR